MTADPAGEPPALALHVGATKIVAALVDRQGRLAGRSRVPTPIGPGVDAETIWRTVAGLSAELLRAGRVCPSGLAGVAVACGGPMVWPEGLVSPLHLPAWRSFPLRARLEEHFPDRPVRVHNDAVCLTVGEHWRGAGRGSQNMAGIVVSAGVGGGLVLGGRLIEGASGNAGHIGHLVVDPGGPSCACGGQGCLEAVIGGPALAAWAAERDWRAVGVETARQLANDARRGHPVAVAALQRAGHALGLAVASLTHLCDLEVVSVGGSLAQAGPLLLAPVEETLRRHAGFGFARAVRVVPAGLGQDAAVVGAAALVHAGRRYWSPVEVRRPKPVIFEPTVTEVDLSSRRLVEHN